MARNRLEFGVNELSLFRRFDPRAKLAVSLAASAAIMLPLPALTVFAAGFGCLLVFAGALGHAAEQVRRLRWLLLVLLIVDAVIIGPGFAMLIVLRLVLMASAFSFLVATTTPDELRSGLERLGLPARGAFALSEAFAALGLLEREWRGIVEAQRARGIVLDVPGQGWRQRLQHLVALLVPAIVLATQRAWAVHEAAATRGFGAPQRRPWDGRSPGGREWALVSAVSCAVAALWWWT